MEVPQNLLELLYRLAEKAIAAQSPRITPNVKHLEAQRSALCEEIGRSRKRLLAHECELVAALNNVKAKVAEHKTSFDASTARVRCLKGKLPRLKAAQAEEVRDATSRVTADKSVRWDALQSEVIVFMQAN